MLPTADGKEEGASQQLNKQAGDIQVFHGVVMRHFRDCTYIKIMVIKDYGI